ncbi:hypothetical protein [Nocardia cyriacigeorgica]|uniref:hypothetical protein n=1 Tax=Nocardia cyriacigeorgica TaxID=135487 RepID=UPI001892DD0E|nr:hypothetical protein [Nocardia cyriacigeorgica]MBF6344508.1 hypothetical protein [Nocardia cyriacigeorgica]
MRTTVDLSPDLMQAAEVAAAARGISSKELFTKALAREVGTTPRRGSAGESRSL